jgi:hypothetical protein
MVRPARTNTGSSRTHQHRVVQDATQPGQGAAHRRRRGVKPLRGGAHRALIEQRVEGDQQVEIEISGFHF